MKSYQNTAIPLEAQYLYRRGLEMIDRKKDDAALVYLRQAVFIAPGFSKAYRELGDCLARQGRFQEASAYLVKASRIDLNHPSAAADSAVQDRPAEENPVPSHFLTCLVW